MKNISNNERKQKIYILLLCIISIIFSNFGFSNLIKVLYPIFGYLGLIQLFHIFIYKC